MSSANIHGLFNIIQSDTYLPRYTFFETQNMVLSHQRVTMDTKKDISEFLSLARAASRQ